jgi:hypothetical protein
MARASAGVRSAAPADVNASPLTNATAMRFSLFVIFIVSRCSTESLGCFLRATRTKHAILLRDFHTGPSVRPLDLGRTKKKL